MRTSQVSLFSLLIFVIFINFVPAQDLSPTDQYKQERLGKRAYERFLHAIEALAQSPDASVISAAAQDAARYAANRDEDARALQSIETALEYLPQDSNEWRETKLVWGKMLTRLDRIDEADAFFQDAIQNNWQNAMKRYGESLIENDHMAGACILECQRIAGLEKYAKYRGEDESLEVFLTQLRQTKDFDSRILLTSDVAGNLDSIADKPEFIEIAQALCLAEDGNPAEAIARLDKIDAQLAEKKDHREYKHIPLYKASILFKEGNDYPAAQAALTEFMKRNEGKNRKIAESTLRIARDIEMRIENCPKMDECLTFLLDTEWFKDENVQKDLTDDNKAELFDVRGVGLAWSGDWQSASVIAKMVADQYPNTLAGVNCLRNYALYHSSNLSEAERLEILNEILSKTTFDDTIASIRVVLAERAIERQDYDTALEHLQDALDYIPVRKKGSSARYRQGIVELIDRVIRLKAGK